MRWHSSGKVVIFRSDFTTTGPIVIGGTKCPSMASTCRRSAYFSTRATSSPSLAKSAERIEGASLYRAAIAGQIVPSARSFPGQRPADLEASASNELRGRQAPFPLELDLVQFE